MPNPRRTTLLLLTLLTAAPLAPAPAQLLGQGSATERGRAETPEERLTRLRRELGVRSSRGQPFDPRTLAVQGKVTLVDFFSFGCGPCLRKAPLLRELERRNGNIRVEIVEVDLAGRTDMDSPLMRALMQRPDALGNKAQGLPHILIYDVNRQLKYSGADAARLVERLLDEVVRRPAS